MFKKLITRIIRILESKQGQNIENAKYRYWLKKHRITPSKGQVIKEGLKDFQYKPLLSIIMPVYNVDIKWINKAIQSVKQQLYTNWELCIADDKSTSQALIKYLKRLEKNSQVKIVFRNKNGHISEASNSAIKLATGEFLVFLDNDDILYPHALAKIVEVLNKNKETDLIYSDEDKLDIKGKRIEPFFKPDWSLDLFLSTNYLCHLTAIRKKLVDTIGGFRRGYEGSQDYDLFLRVTEATKNIEHIPDILYSWRKIPGSTASVYSDKGYAENASLSALKDAIKRRKLNATVIKGLFPGSFRVKYEIKGKPLVSILISTKDDYKSINKCVSSIFEKTTYQNFEVIIIDSNSLEKETLDYYITLKGNPKIKLLNWKKKYNYSAVNNYGVQNSSGEYILLLNSNTTISSPDWIEGMLEHAQREKIGAVGIKLFYPNNTTNHVGIVLTTRNHHKDDKIAHYVMRGSPNNIIGIPYTKDIIRNYSAVSTVCLMIEKKKYLKIGGLDEIFEGDVSSIDFCLKLIKAGYNNIYTPYVELYYNESTSLLNTKKDIQLVRERWYDKIQRDPYYNINLKLENTYQ